MGKYAGPIIALVLIVLAIASGILSACGWLTMVLWNFLIGSGFHGPTITFWDGTGMVALLCFLFCYVIFTSWRRRRRE